MFKKLLLGLSLICACVGIARADQFSLQEFLGMDVEDAEFLLKTSKSPDMNNVDPSINGLSILRKKGQLRLFNIAYATHHVTSMGNIKNNSYDRVLLGYGPHVEVFDTAYSGTMIHSSATVGYVWDFAQYQENTYATNGVDTVFYTDGNDKTFITSAPKGTSLVFFNNTAFIANVSGNRARVYNAVYGDPTDWTTGVGKYDGDSVDVADYGEKVIDLAVLGNSILVLCSNSLMKIIGNQNPYLVIEVDKSIGCSSKGSISTYRGQVYFLGSDGQMYRTDGITVEDISTEEFYKAFNNTAVSQRNSNFSTITLQSEFDNGISSHTSYTAIPHSVALSSGTTTYTSASDWNSWTYTTRADSTTTSGSVQLAPRGTTIIDDFQDGDYVGWFEIDGNWSAVSQYLQATPNVLQTGTPAEYASKIEIGLATYAGAQRGIRVSVDITPRNDPNNIYVRLYGRSANPGFHIKWYTSGLVQVVTTDSGGSTTTGSFTGPAMVDGVAHEFTLIQDSSTFKVQVDDVEKYNASHPQWGICSRSQNITLEAWHTTQGAVAADFDNIQYENMYYQSGQITSPVIDTLTEDGFNLFWGTLDVSSTVPTHTTVVYQVRSSTAEAIGAGVTWTNVFSGSQPVVNANRYVQLRSSFTTQNALYTPTIADIELDWATTGYYITDKIAIADINSWGLFEAANSGILDSNVSITYSVVSSSMVISNAALKSTTTWTSQANNATIVVSTQPYVWVKSVFSITVATQIPSVESLTVNWVSGADTNEDMTACWYKKRLYLGVMKSTNSSTNDSCFVFDPALDAWWKYSTGTYPSALFNWNNKFLIASSTSSVVSNFLKGDLDINDPIDAYYYSKELPVGSLNQISSFDILSIMYERQTAGTLKLEYFLNGSTTAGSDPFLLGQTGGNSVHIDNFKFPQGANGFYIQFKISNVSGADFNFYGLLGTSKEFPLRINQ